MPTTNHTTSVENLSTDVDNSSHNFLSPLGEKIFLDRYALKDGSKQSLAVGDTVIVCVDLKTGQREIGTVRSLSNGIATIELRDGAIVERAVEHIDKPLEVLPEQMMERVARGIAAVEATEEKRAEWERKFRWLLDGWKFVPGGRILTAAGTEQQLTLYNCYVIPSPRDSRKGIVDTLSQMMEIMSRGGGVGINISSLRPRHAYVKGVNGRSSGAVSWGALYSFVTGLIEQGGCFGPEERILTHQGLLPARELCDRLEAGECLYAQTHQGLRPFTAYFRNGVKPLYAVTTRRGYRVCVTAEHKMAVLRDGAITTVPLADLREGDEILLLLGEGVQKGYVPLKPVAYERSIMSTTLNEEVKLPSVLNEDVAYLIGYMHGDGYVHIGRKVNWSAPKAVKMATADAHPEIRQRIVETVRRAFGLEPRIEDGGGAVKSVAIYSRLLIEWLSTNGLLKAKANQIRVPEAIFRSPSSVMGAFIAGYFDADGCYRGRKAGYGIDSISLPMLRDVQQILAINGIVSRLSATDRSAQGWQTIYRLTITGATFKRRFAQFVSAAKKSDENGKRDMFHTYPAEVWTNLGARAKYRQRIYDGVSDRISVGQMRSIGERLTNDGQVAMAERVDELLNTLPDPIVSIEPVGESEVFDFEVDDVHLLSGAGIYTSNSRRGALMLILNVWHPDVLDFITSKREMGKITNANISVGITDDFMQAVKEDRDWDLVFPDTGDPDYDELWDGDLTKWKSLGKPVIVHKTVRAREVWNAIIESAWASAEPGVWFMDRANQMSNSFYYAPLVSTNPCTTGDTWVATEHGYTKARDLKVGMKIRTPVGLKPIEKVYNNGLQRVYRVEFSDGGYLECTRDHKLKVVRDKKYEWVPVSGLRRGDRVLVSANESFGPRQNLPQDALDYIAKRGLNVASYYDRNLGFLVGVVIGDGTLREVHHRGSHSYQCQIAFGAHEDNWIHHFSSLMEAMNIHAHHTRAEKEVPLGDGTLAVHASVRLECYKLATLLVKIGMKPNLKACEKVIPKAFLGMEKEFLAGILDGLFSTDGSVLVKRDNPMLRFHTTSYELAQQVRLLLLQFGIHGRIYRQTRENDLEYDGRSMFGTGEKYDVVIMNEGIPRFYSEIGLSHPEKAERLKEIAQNWHYLGGTWTATVVSIQDMECEEEVYDVYEPDTLTWVTNGYVSLDCGEQPLPAFSVCNLGAINLAKFVWDGQNVDWEALRKTVRYAVRFLDNVIDATPYFFEENERQQKSERRVGLGTMGLAEMLIRLGIRYGSEESVKFIDQLYKFIATEAYLASAEYAEEKGPFPLFDAEKFLQSGFMRSMPDNVRQAVRKKGIRNVTLLTQAPTGTTGTMVGTSTGIEPFYFWTYYRKSRLGKHEERVKVMEEWQQAHPNEPLPDYFVTAMDLTPEEHVRVEAAIQRWTDSSISKTCNVPQDYTVEQTRQLYELMYELGCKGGTIYRDKSRDEQVLHLKEESSAEKEKKPIQKVRPRPYKRRGVTISKATPVGTAHITMNDDEEGNPFEVFIEIGKAGSDIKAMSEAIGRLMSLVLRLASPVTPKERVQEIVNQIRGIGGARHLGFGKDRVMSLPDAVGQALEEHYGVQSNGNGHSLLEDEHPAAADGKPPYAGADLCPQCGLAVFVRTEGCHTCLSCGYSEC